MTQHTDTGADPLFRTPAQISPSAISTALRAAGVIDQGAVTSLELEPIQEHSAFNAQLVRLYLSYDLQKTGAPKSLVAKLPTARAELHENAAVFQPGLKECWFYRVGASQTPLHVPHCYYNMVDPATGASILLLQDLAPARAGNQLAGASVDHAKLALQAAARLHGAWWQNELLEELFDTGELGAPADAAQDFVAQLFRQSWPRFVANSQGDMPPNVRRFGDYLATHMSELAVLGQDSPKTLTHGDYRLDNMLIHGVGEESTCWVIDWEDIDFGTNMWDVAWFIGGCLDVRARHVEQTLLQCYYDALVAQGVSRYTWPECQNSYRYNMCSAFVQGVLMATSAPPNNEYATKLAHTIGQRFVDACQRLRLHEFIS